MSWMRAGVIVSAVTAFLLVAGMAHAQSAVQITAPGGGASVSGTVLFTCAANSS